MSRVIIINDGVKEAIVNLAKISTVEIVRENRAKIKLNGVVLDVKTRNEKVLSKLACEIEMTKDTEDKCEIVLLAGEKKKVLEMCKTSMITSISDSAVMVYSETNNNYDITYNYVLRKIIENCEVVDIIYVEEFRVEL